MPSQPQVVALAAHTVAASAALVCGLMFHRDAPVNVFTFQCAIAFETMLDEQCYNGWFCRHLRCSQATFRKLCSMLRGHFDQKPYKKYSFERVVACTLFHLGSSGGFRETAQAFGVSKAWCIVNVNSIVRVLTQLRSTHIKLPATPEEWEIEVSAFHRVQGFPLCCGAIDGTLIAINRPQEFEGWYNRKGFPSLNVQAVCDHRKRLTSFDVRPGSWSDAKIFEFSVFGRNIERILPRGHHILADAGYGVSPAVMTPYNEKDEGGSLTNVQTKFNYKLSSTRMVIEGAFGLLKERFNILKKPLEERTPRASVRVVVACLVLHNLLIDFQDTTNFELSGAYNSGDEERIHQSQTNREKKLKSRLGCQKRDDIAADFTA